MPTFAQLNSIYLMLDLTPTKIGEDFGGIPGVIPTITVFENKLVSTTESFYSIGANDYAETSADAKELLIKDGWKIELVEYPGVLSEGGTAYKPGSTFDAVSTLLDTYITLVPAIPRKSVDLTTLAGWEALSSGTHNITVVAKADGFKDSAPSATVQVEKAAAMPVKGDIITMDAKQYRVLKVNGSVAEVLAMYNANSSIAFDSASSNYNNTYAEKSLDTYCNSTFYSGLSAEMKNAIVDKTFTQDSWRWFSSVPTGLHYTGKYGKSTYYLTLDNATFGSSITRHCYVLSVQDVLDYLGTTTSMGTSDTTLTDTNIWKMFWNRTTYPDRTYLWLRSASATGSNAAFRIDDFNGYLDTKVVGFAYAVRPAFQIDLSKIAWSK